MKAICLLLCVALSREIAGSIFHRHHQPKGYYKPGIQQPLKPYGYADQITQQSASSSSQSLSMEEPYSKPYLQRALRDKLEKFTDLKPVQKIKEVAKNLIHGHHTPLFADANAPVSLAVTPMDLSGDILQWKNVKFAAGHGQVVGKKDIAKIYQSALSAQKHITAAEKEMIQGPLNAALQQSQGYALNATEMLKRYGYPAEEHVVKTEDGYYLTIFRIPPRSSVGEGKTSPVVFLMHDILGSADDFLVRGPKRSLAYLLADAGYDVYLSNARSSKYSRHVNHHRALPGYWQFSNDEIVLYDLPVMINYALQNSNQTKMFYIGHGMGSTVFFALAAVRPEYNDKVMMMYALSPMAYLQHARTPMLRMLAQSSPIGKRLNKELGYGEFRPSAELVRSLGGDLCDSELDNKLLCSNAYVAFSGLNVKNLEIGDITALLLHLPAGASVKQMKQLTQAYDSHEFRMFDYGSDLNMEVYGQRSPPAFNMKNVSARFSLFYSEHDWLAHPKDVMRLYSELPHVDDIYKIRREYFTHMDFLFGTQARELVYERLLISMDLVMEGFSML